MKQRKPAPAFIRNRLPAAVIILAAALLSVSCVNPLEKIGGTAAESAVLPEGMVSLSVCIGGFPRSAFPSDFSGLDWKVTVTKDGDNPQEPVAAESASGAFVCGFYYKGTGNYTVTLDGYTKNDPAEKVYTGSATVEITESMVMNNVVAVTVNGKFTATTETEPGAISLELAAAEGSAVTGFSVQCISDTDSDVRYSTQIDNASGTVEHIGVTPGVYTMTINALNSDGELVYVHIEKVTVCPGLTTDTWVMSDGTTPDTLIVTDDARLFTTFYVAGEGGTFYSTVDSKTCTYGEERKGNDESETGSIDAPFATVSRAIKKCSVTGKDYTVYVDGTVTESASIEIPKGVKVTVKSLAGSTSGSDIDPTATIKAASGTTNMITIATDAKLTMTDITLEGQSIGRGIYVTGGECTLTNCIITTHKADNGGGIYIDGGTVTLNKTQITKCTATYGGGVYVNAGTFAMNTGAAIACNEAAGNDSIFGQGGGVCIGKDGTFIMNAGAITANMATRGTSFLHNGNGGGVCVQGGTFTMNGGTIGGNSAYSAGAGVYAGTNSTFTMSGGTIGDNTAGDKTTGLGGGVYSFGKFEMKAGTISGNSVGLYGGGVYVDAGTFEMSNTAAISGNTAPYGGGIYVVNGGKFTMTAGTVSGNNSTTKGGGVYVSGNSTFRMSDGTISSNTAASGGGVCKVGAGTFEMSAGTISGNTATGTEDTNGGGGVYVSAGKFEMKAGTISGNSATGTKDTNGGGGVYVLAGEFTMTDGTISGNTAKMYGGGVFKTGTDKFTMTGGTIGGGTAYDETNDNKTDMGNTAANGGGVYVSAGEFTMTDGTISGNSATSGGGVYVLAGEFTMTDGTISGNMAENSISSKGGGVCLSDSGAGTFAMTGGTISYNNATFAGGGVCMNEDGTCTFKMSGAPKITDNTVGGSTTNNVYLPVDESKNTITITGAFTNGASVGITLDGLAFYSSPITSGFTSSGNTDTASPFFSDNTAFWNLRVSSGEIYPYR